MTEKSDILLLLTKTQNKVEASSILKLADLIQDVS